MATRFSSMMDQPMGAGGSGIFSAIRNRIDGRRQRNQQAQPGVVVGTQPLPPVPAPVGGAQPLPPVPAPVGGAPGGPISTLPMPPVGGAPGGPISTLPMPSTQPFTPPIGFNTPKPMPEQQYNTAGMYGNIMQGAQQGAIQNGMGFMDNMPSQFGGMVGLGSMAQIPDQGALNQLGSFASQPFPIQPPQGAMGQSVGSLYGQQSGMVQPTAPPTFGQSTPSAAQAGIGQLFGQFQGQNPQAVAPFGAGIM